MESWRQRVGRRLHHRRWERRRGVRVSVVVAVYAPGPELDDLVLALEAQTIGTDALELVLVDDGSPDPSVVPRLWALAAGRPWVDVVTIAPSGWPGRPRNVGMDRARGEYVFFSDQDDTLFPAALERAVEMADANGSDVVAVKVVRTRLVTPYWNLARRDVDRADLVDDGVMQSRTVHKLFRVAFLREHGIRFLEGRVRLEDHHFMATVFAHDPVVSVLASTPGYRWVDRGDGTNNSATPIALDVYWGHFARAVDAVEGAPVRVQEALRSIAASQALGRTEISSFDRSDDDTRAAALSAVGDFVRGSVPVAAAQRLGLLHRAQVETLRAGDAATLVALRTAWRTARVVVGVARLEWEDDALRVEVTISLVSDDKEVVSVRDGRCVVAGVASDHPGDLTLRDTDAPRAEITVRHRDSAVEWPVPTTIESATTGEDGTLQQVRCVGRVRPYAGAFGAPLDLGPWRVLVRWQGMFGGALRAVEIAEDEPLISRRAYGDHADGAAEAWVHRQPRGGLEVRVRVRGRT